MCLYSVESTGVFLFDHELLVLSRYEAVKQVLVANSSQGAHERQIHICRHRVAFKLYLRGTEVRERWMMCIIAWSCSHKTTDKTLKTRRDWSSEVDVTYDDEIVIRKTVEHTYNLNFQMHTNLDCLEDKACIGP